MPIVFYHGHHPWRAATELSQLMLSPPDGLERFQANQKYLLIDQRHDSDRGDIVSLLFDVLRASTEAEIHVAAIAFAKRMRQADLASVRDSLANWLQLTLQDDLGGANLDIEEDFAMPPKRKFRFEEVFNDEFFEELKKGPEESRQLGLEQGIQEGRQQGVQQGLQQGELLALRDVLDDLLTGDVPAAAAPKIAEADSSQLRAWIKSLIAGVSPQQLFAEG
nr:Rpn family recombination-promoting nuclease/putative transposase [Duganella rivi]